MYDNIAAFFDSYGEREWERLDTAYGRLIFCCHMWFIQRVNSDSRVLDAGCGAGRFAVRLAKAGCDVTLLDISQKQLDIAEDKMHENNLEGRYIQASVTDMSMIDDDSMDIALCLGGVLSYIHDGAAKAMAELTRVVKPGGRVIVSVNSRYGVLRACASELKMPMNDFWGDPKRWGINEVLTDGNETEYPGAKQPRRHYYTSQELRTLFEKAGLGGIELAAAPAVFTGQRANVAELSRDETAWTTLLRTEQAAYRTPGLADGGEFIMAAGIKK